MKRQKSLIYATYLFLNPDIFLFGHKTSHCAVHNMMHNVHHSICVSFGRRSRKRDTLLNQTRLVVEAIPYASSTKDVVVEVQDYATD